MRIALVCAFLLLAAGCSNRSGEGEAESDATDRDEPPVALDADPPVVYPPNLYQQKIEGTVTLRLFVTEQGAVVAESTLVAESSGYPEFDSAAMAGVPRMRFAPAQRDGRPIATAFTQPVHFRMPQAEGSR
jgi:TonB family protein